MNKSDIFCQLYRMLLILVAGAVFSTPSYALTTSFTLQQLSDFLNGYRNSSDTHKQFLWEDLQKELAAQGISLAETGLALTGTTPAGNTTIINDCRTIFFLPIPSTPQNASYSSGSYSELLNGTQSGFSFQYAQNRIVFDVKLAG